MAITTAANNPMMIDGSNARCSAELRAPRTSRPFLFFQPFGVSDLGGGARILRSLLASSPTKCISIVTTVRRPRPTNTLEQIHFPTRPHFGRIETTRFHWVPETLHPVWTMQHRR